MLGKGISYYKSQNHTTPFVSGRTSSLGHNSEGPQAPGWACLRPLATPASGRLDPWEGRETLSNPVIGGVQNSMAAASGLKTASQLLPPRAGE